MVSFGGGARAGRQHGGGVEEAAFITLERLDELGGLARLGVGLGVLLRVVCVAG